MKKVILILAMGLLLTNCTGQKTGKLHLGQKGSPMFYATASDEDIEAYEESRIEKYVSWSVSRICIEWDTAGYNTRIFMSEALERKGEDPLKCRVSSQ
jgi:hypothetical protein